MINVQNVITYIHICNLYKLYIVKKYRMSYLYINESVLHVFDNKHNTLYQWYPLHNCINSNKSILFIYSTFKVIILLTLDKA